MIRLLKRQKTNLANQKPNNFRCQQRGFTFVELLVVTTIIVLLSMIGLANYRTINQKSRDSKRKSDLEQIRASLELYRTDEGGYPADGSITCNGTLTAGSKTYMDPIPCDPKSPSQDYAYDQVSATSYTLQAILEIDTTTGTCTPTGDNTYCVKQP